jgi:hypothetical protein
VEIAQPRSRFGPDPRAKSPPPGKAPPNRPAKGRPSVGQHVFVIGHRVHIPTRFVGVGPCGTRGGQAGGRGMPGAEMAKNLPTEKGLRRMYWARLSRSALASGGTEPHTHLPHSGGGRRRCEELRQERHVYSHTCRTIRQAPQERHGLAFTWPLLAVGGAKIPIHPKNGTCDQPQRTQRAHRKELVMIPSQRTNSPAG